MFLFSKNAFENSYISKSIKLLFKVSFVWIWKFVFGDHSAMNWLSLNGSRTSWKNHSQAKTCTKSKCYPESKLRSTPPNLLNRNSNPKQPEANRYYNLQWTSPAKPEASGHAPSPVTGPRASSCFPPPPLHPSLTPSRNRPKRRRRRKKRIPIPPVTAGSACIARPRRPRSGEPGLWVPKRCAMHVVSDSNRVGWYPNTDPPRARRLCPQNTRTRIGRCLNSDVKRIFRGLITINFLVKPPFSAQLTVTITWFITTLGLISGIWSNLCRFSAFRVELHVQQLAFVLKIQSLAFSGPKKEKEKKRPKLEEKRSEKISCSLISHFPFLFLYFSQHFSNWESILSAWEFSFLLP